MHGMASAARQWIGKSSRTDGIAHARYVLLALLAAFAAPASASAQQGRTIGRPTTLTAHEFTHISAVRELSDGGVLILDDREQRLALVEASGRLVDSVLRKGRGPGEYLSLASLVTLPDDSTLLVATPQRWIILHRARVVSTQGPESGQPLRGRLVHGADGQGYVLVRSTRNSQGEMSWPHLADRIIYAKARREGQRLDTIADLRQTPLQLNVMDASSGDHMLRIILASPMFTTAQALLFPDGWVAVAHLEPYRVEWVRPDGGRVPGVVLDSLARPVTDREKRVAVARAGIWTPRGEVKPAVDDYKEWPKTVPAFGERALRAMPGGRLLVARFPHAESKTTDYDVVTRGGRLERRLQLEPNERIVGFGARGMYVAVRDADELEALVRRPIP